MGRRVRLHGLVIESDLDLAGGPVGKAELTDVYVTVRTGGRVSRQPASARPGQVLVQVDDAQSHQRYEVRTLDSGWVMDFVGTAVAVIDPEVGSVEIEAVPGVAPGLVSTLVNGPLATALVLLRGGVVVHASGIVTGSEVVAIAGPAGSGKSTVAALTAGPGRGFFSDDALSLRFDRVGVTALRGTLRSRLRTDLVARSSGQQTTTISDDGRRLTTHDHDGVPDEAALAAVLLPRLSPSFDRVAVQAVAGKTALASLGCALAGLRSPRMLAAHFHAMTELVGRVPVYALEVPWNGSVPSDALRRELRHVVDSVVVSRAGTARG